MNFASCSRTRLAFGPGNAVTSRGVFTSNVVGIASSTEETKGWSCLETAGQKQARKRTDPPVACRRKKIKLSLRRRVLAAGRPAGEIPGRTKGEFGG